MTTFAKARIDFEGHQGVCDVHAATVSRSMPAVLNEYMSGLEWINFCDRLDEALEPLVMVKKVNLARMVVTLLSFVGVFLYVVAVVSDNGGSGPVFRHWTFFLAPWIIIMAITITALFYVNSKTTQVNNSVRRVCEEESNKKPSLSFHVRLEAPIFRSHGDSSDSSHAMSSYIEVNVADVTPESSIPMATAFYSPETVDSRGSSVKTSAERLSELESLKHHLSSTEYDHKRAEILGQV